MRVCRKVIDSLAAAISDSRLRLRNIIMLVVVENALHMYDRCAALSFGVRVVSRAFAGALEGVIWRNSRAESQRRAI
jgi:hypothetical protein